jgi:hypothetical protein
MSSKLSVGSHGSAPASSQALKKTWKMQYQPHVNHPESDLGKIIKKLLKFIKNYQPIGSKILKSLNLQRPRV